MTHYSVVPIHAFSDNYIWTMVPEDSHEDSHGPVVVVDPGCASSVLTYLDSVKRGIDAILITHHHSDHIGGVSELQAAFPEVKVYASKNHSFDFPHIPVAEGDTIHTSLLQATVWEIPGHTATHIGYHLESAHQFFCGDTLFASGCGRVFCGSLPSLYHSLMRLTQLPDNTTLYPTHEYTLDNILFSMKVSSDKAFWKSYHQEMEHLRNTNIETVPTTIAREKKYNLFLRCHEPWLHIFCEKYAHANLLSEQDIFSWLRIYKDKEFD